MFKIFRELLDNQLISLLLEYQILKVLYVLTKVKGTHLRIAHGNTELTDLNTLEEH